MNAGPILVVGATGSIGGLIVDSLVESGYSVRASSRRAITPGFRGAIETVTADYDDPRTLSSAAAGVRTAFIYTPTRNAERNAAALRDAGVEQVVMLSSGTVLLNGVSKIPSAVIYREAEQVFAKHISNFLPVRPLRLALDAFRWASAIRELGGVSVYRSDAASAPLHEQDVVDVAVHALRTGDQRSTAAITGPSLMTQAEQITIISEIIGKPIKIHEQTPDEAVTGFARHSNLQAARATVAFLDNAAEGGSPVTQTVPDVLGRAARSFRTWVESNRHAFM